jgi:hypothetical protein
MSYFFGRVMVRVKPSPKLLCILVGGYCPKHQVVATKTRTIKFSKTTNLDLLPTEKDLKPSVHKSPLSHDANHLHELQDEDEEKEKAFEAFVVVDVLGIPSKVTPSYFTLLQDIFLTTYQLLLLSNQDDQRCKQDLNEEEASSILLLLTDAELLQEPINAYGDQTLGDPSVDPLNTQT